MKRSIEPRRIYAARCMADTQDVMIVTEYVTSGVDVTIFSEVGTAEVVLSKADTEKLYEALRQWHDKQAKEEDEIDS